MTKPLQIGKFSVYPKRKAIKHMYLCVYPPHGEIRMHVPVDTSEETIKRFVLSKSSWLEQQCYQFQQQLRQPPRLYRDGESHYYQGHRYRLQICHTHEKPFISFPNKTFMYMHVGEGSTRAERDAVMFSFYRKKLYEEIASLRTTWEGVIGVKPAEVRLRKMKTRWGTCNFQARRIWLNTELMKYPHTCLTYVFVHEMVHLLERKHNARFFALMDRFLPAWRYYKDELNRCIRFSK